jgi:hypothetical protein
MINLGRLSGTMCAAALLLCAFPGATGGQEKTPPVVTEQRLEKSRTDLDSLKIEQRLKDIEQRLDRIESWFRQHPPRPKPDAMTRDSDLEWCCRHINHTVVCYR